jgi:hypothetical protein
VKIIISLPIFSDTNHLLNCIFVYKRREQGTGNREQGTDKKHSFAPV